MGASLAAACRGQRLWASAGRSPATADRSHAAGLTDVGSLAALVDQCDVIVSVCPPAAALDVADSVAKLDFDGIYVDANAVAPATTRMIASRFARFVDGGVVGPPVEGPGTTRLYLAGDAAAEVAALWDGSALGTRVIDGPVGAASAVKMCYAAWTKGSAALLLAVRALAEAEDVDDVLGEEWDRSIPGLTARVDATATGNAPKAWRFTGEMEEIAATFAADRLPDGFFDAAAEVYARLARFKDSAPLATEVIAALLSSARVR
jgi:3-hydroxyisobutyrate dehydrogenase-like beta-hydroxyacid dehydrogenase